MANPPNAPTTPQITNVGEHSITAKVEDNGNGGDAINARELGVDRDPEGKSKTLFDSDRWTTVDGLASGTTFYIWARCHNSEGWGPWSGRAKATTLDVPDAPSSPLISSVTATSVDVAFSPNSSNGSKITAYQIGYGTTPSIPVGIVSAKSPQVVDGLIPGKVYYFTVRAKNAVGWSAWSATTKVRTVAGAYVKVGTQWKLAIPYVRVGGVWKMAEAWTRDVGVWKRTK